MVKELVLDARTALGTPIVAPAAQHVMARKMMLKMVNACALAK